MQSYSSSYKIVHHNPYFLYQQVEEKISLELQNFYKGIYQLINNRMIQDQLSSIVRKFKQNEYYQYSANKQNNYRRQSSKIQQNSSKQQVQSLSKKVKYLQNVIEKMIVDGNKMHRYYEELLIESAMQFQTFKQEYNGFRCSTSQQKKQGENLVQYLSAKIDTLSRQISNKQELYRQLLQKYEQLEERAAEAHLQESAHMKDIQKQLAKESMHREEQRMLTTQQIQQIKQDLEQAMEVNEQLLNQNNYLKNMNESLAHNIEYLKNKLYAENNIIHQSQQQYQENRLSLIELERCEVDSISREEDRLTLDQIKMNQSQENIFNGQKQVLNLSEHYSKFNRTQQFLTKQKSNYQFVMMESNQRKSFAKRKELISQNKNVLIKIDSIESKNEEPNIKSRHITEIKQFKMQQTVPAESVVDPYKAFFLLLTQCEKMNSPYFEKISHIDLTYLYPQLIKAYIPYNKWQDNIRNELLGKVHKK